MSAAITAAVVTAAGSAYSSYKAGSAADKAAKRARKAIKQGYLQEIGFGDPSGEGMYANYDPETGKISTRTGAELDRQIGQVGDFRDFFGGQIGGNQLADAFGALATQRNFAYDQPQINPGLFNSLQGQTGVNLGAAQGQIGGALRDAAFLNPLGNQGFGLAGQYMSELAGGSDAVRGRTLDLLRQQAQPFEDRAFTSLLDNQYATGRLGSSGGALQTEAFARGLAQADTARQLAANQEGRNFQQNALGLAQGGFGIGQQQRGLSDRLLSNAFSNFGNLAGLSQDIEQSRYNQASSAQMNAFNQFGSLARNFSALAQQQQGMDQGAFGNFLRAISAGQALQDRPLDLLDRYQGYDIARSNAASGVGNSLSRAPAGTQTYDNLAAVFSGLGQAAQGWGGFGGGGSTNVGNAFTPVGGGGYQPTNFGGPGPVIQSGTSMWGSNPFAGMNFGG